MSAIFEDFFNGYEEESSIEIEERAAIQEEPITEESSIEIEERAAIQEEPITEESAIIHTDKMPLFPLSIIDDMPTFDNYIGAHLGNTEAPLEYHFGALKCIIGASLGKRIYINENRAIYPNSYVALIGKSGRARKSHSMSLAFDLLSKADQNVCFSKSINSSEGLASVFGLPFGCILGRGLTDFGEPEFQMPKGGISDFIKDENLLQEMLLATEENEGFRMVAYIDELSHLLLKARNTVTANLPQMIQALYDMPTSADRLTKNDKERAPHPCFSFVGASTIAQFHSSVSATDIHGGFANRFEYYVVGDLDRIGISKPSDNNKLIKSAAIINRLRKVFWHSTAFEYTEDAAKVVNKKYNEYCDIIDNEQNAYVADTLARFDLQAKKNALIFAALDLSSKIDIDVGNVADKADCLIGTQHIENAYKLQKYLIDCARFLYGDFAETQMGEVENKILKAISSKSSKDTPAKIRNHTMLDAAIVNQALAEMLKAGILIAEKPKGARSLKYSIA